MELIDQLQVQRVHGARPALIQLLHGDLAAIPPSHAVDVLVVSAFPDMYTPSPGTLFESLYMQRLDLQHVADAQKEEDVRDHLGCWLSRELPNPVIERLRFRRILCFEPRHPKFLRHSGLRLDAIEDSVAFVFRCLNYFIIPDKEKTRDFRISTVAMPLLATGNQRVPLEAMFPELLDAAIFWLEQGLPIDVLKIVAFKEADSLTAASIFQHRKSAVAERLAKPNVPEPVADVSASHWEARLAQALTRQMIDACRAGLREDLLAAARDDERAVLERVLSRVRGSQTSPQPSSALALPGVSQADVFISYAHKQQREVNEFVEALKQHMPAERIFFDRTSIPAGGQWIRVLSDALQNVRTFVAVLSPDYTASPVCWDEFQCAKLREYGTRQAIIKTVLLYKHETMPPMMGIHSYIDCIEGDLRKLRQSAASIAGPGH